MQRWWRGTIAAGALLACASACAGEAGVAPAGGFCPPDCPAATPTAPPAPTTDAFGLPPEPPTPPPPADAWNPADLRLVLEDPRLAAAAAEDAQDHHAAAADLLAAAIAILPPNAPERAAWLYQLGKQRALGGAPGPAAKAFVACAAIPGPLVDFANLQAAQWFAGVSAWDDAIAAAKKVEGDPALAPAVDLVLADALAGKGDADGSLARLKAYLGRDRHPANWVHLSLRYAGALLQRPSDAHSEEALKVARRVLDEAPGGAGAANAKDLEKTALDRLPNDKKKRLGALSEEEQLARARSLVASNQSAAGLVVAMKVLKLPKAKKPGAFSCDAHLARAEALKNLRKKADAAEAYGQAADACAGEARLAEALYNAGRTLAQSGRTTEAMRRYAELERDAPAHRLADDARYKGALAALDANDPARFEDMLRRMPDDYPKGDMVVDGLVALALYKGGRGDWQGAIAPLERALRIAPHERAYYAAGRLPYYLARAHLATGNVEQGKAELAKVISDHPLSFYMGLAFARFADLDRAGAERALADVVAHEPRGVFTIPKGAWLTEPAFARAVELAREGDVKLTRGQLDRLGFGARTAPHETMWAGVFLLSKAGSPTMSHGILRTANQGATHKPGDLVDWLDHYPVGPWKAAWELAFPRPFEAVVAPAARAQHLPEAWAHAIMREESAFDARVASPAKAYGLMQLIVPTAKRMGQPMGIAADEEALKRPEINVQLGCRYLSFLRNMFPDNPLMAIPGYNAGGNAPKRWIAERPTEDFDIWVEKIPYEETRNYTKRVITSLLAYEFLYARGAPSEALRMPLSASPAAKKGVAAAATVTDDNPAPEP